MSKCRCARCTEKQREEFKCVCKKRKRNYYEKDRYCEEENYGKEDYCEEDHYEGKEKCNHSHKTIVHPTVYCTTEERHHHHVKHIVPIVCKKIEHHHRHHDYIIKKKFECEHKEHEHGKREEDWCRVVGCEKHEKHEEKKFHGYEEGYDFH